MINITIGDQFKEFLYSDKRDFEDSHVKIGIVKSFYKKNEEDFALIVFEKRDQLKVKTEINIKHLVKVGHFWNRI